MADREIEAALQDLRLIKSMLAQARGRVSAGAPFFLVWGIVWLVGFLLPAAGIGRSFAGWSWLVLDLAGVGASAAIGVRHGRTGGPLPLLVRQWFWAAAVLTTAVFGMALLAAHFGATLLVVWPIGLLVGTWFALGGILFGSATFLLLGAWLAALSLGVPLLPVGSILQSGVMGALGGGAMVVASFLVRREDQRG